MKKLLITIIKIIIFVPLVYYFANNIAEVSFTEYSIGVLAISLLVIVALIYRLTTYKDVRSNFYNDTLFKSIAEARLLAWFVMSILVCFFVNIILVRLYFFSMHEWIALSLIIPIFVLVRFIVDSFSKFIFKDLYYDYVSTKYSVVYTVIIMSAIFPLVIYFFTKDIHTVINQRLGDTLLQDFNMVSHFKDSNTLVYFISCYFVILNPYTYFSIFPLLKSVYPIFLFFGNGLLFYISVHFLLFLSLNYSDLSLIFKTIGDKTQPIKKIKLSIIPIVLALLILSQYNAEKILKKDIDVVSTIKDNTINMAIAIDTIRFPKEAILNKLNKIFGR